MYFSFNTDVFSHFKITNQFRKSNPEVNKYMDVLNISGDYKKLEGIYIERVLKEVYSLNMSAVVWQEVFDNRAGTLNKDTIVHVWKPYHYMADVAKVFTQISPIKGFKFGMYVFLCILREVFLKKNCFTFFYFIT
jgi:N-acetyl-beta-hexosaminidase